MGHFDLLFDLVYSGVKTSVSKITQEFQLEFQTAYLDVSYQFCKRPVHLLERVRYLDVYYQYLGQVRRWANLTFFLT